jgi:hypothetical protein
MAYERHGKFCNPTHTEIQNSMKGTPYPDTLWWSNGYKNIERGERKWMVRRERWSNVHDVPMYATSVLCITFQIHFC